MGKKLKAMFFNGSPRKNKNAAVMLPSPEDYMKVIGYPAILDENAKVMEDIYDYSRYDFNLFSDKGD